MRDTIEESLRIEKIVCRGDERKYYRFRPAKFYGGIATADCLGCSLRCIFCWSWKNLSRSEEIGRFHTPDQVAEKLTGIARRYAFRQIRLSGNEPTLGRGHLIQVLRKIPGDLHFILETNGILLGGDRSYAEELSPFANLHVRVSLKGASREAFSRLTGCRPEGFDLQLEALRNLRRHRIDCHPALMACSSSQREIRELLRIMEEIGFNPASVEHEELILYPAVEKRLREAGLSIE